MQNNISKIKSIKKLKEVYDRYDLTINSTHNFYANEILIHNTSCRVGYLPVKQPLKWWQKLLKLQPAVKYELAVGSRRVVKQVGESNTGTGGGFYNTDLWTDSSKLFKGKLEKGETVFYEIVGYLPNTSTPIMGSHTNDKLKNFMDKNEFKAFTAKFGSETTFKYGCKLGGYDVFVYRMTFQNEDGYVVDYSWEHVKSRCIKMNVNYVPEIRATTPVIDSERWNHMFYDKNTNELVDIVKFVKEEVESESKFFPEHIKEGVVVRLDSYRTTPGFYKVKGFLFKAIEGIIKDSAQSPDMEESQSNES